ncbi:MAG: PHP domain-containing protein [Streptosporangiales bacterium]|nr:PHP domain-containing protein [Streptosporangiales bacterium]MBO0891353.1 PHP domain-containing protein [Acidothermales bacterium]
MPAKPVVGVPSDSHVHTEWSYDAVRTGSMARTCERAIELGLPAVAFTEHVDFTEWGEGDDADEDAPAITRANVRPLDVDGYQACVAECRERFPGLRIRTGIETGEAHLFRGSVARVLKAGTFDRVLGSLHAIEHDGRLVDPGRLLGTLPADEVMDRYFTEMVRLVEGSDVFEVLAHVDYPRRYWRYADGAYDEQRYEDLYRAVFRALAGTGRVLEFNTKSPFASVRLICWWYDEGGAAVSFGSDTHSPDRVGDRFDLAVDIVEAAGFRPGRDRYDYWRR